MSIGWRKKQKNIITSNWITNPDGSVVPADIRIYPSLEHGVYEIEISKDILGIHLESDANDEYILVSSLSDESRYIRNGSKNLNNIFS